MQVDFLTTALLLISVIALVATGMIKRPGIGVLGTLLIIGYLAFSQPKGWSAFGFYAQTNWMTTTILGFVIGTALALVALVFIEPLAERITKQPHDLTVVQSVRGSFAALIQWLLIVWILVGLIEETIYRGYLMIAFIDIFGASPGVIAASLFFSSLVFGLSHYYQGPSGAISATLVGFIIGLVFIFSEFNLWLAILIHGFIDTVQLVLIFYNKDEVIKNWLQLPG